MANRLFSPQNYFTHSRVIIFHRAAWAGKGVMFDFARTERLCAQISPWGDLSCSERTYMDYLQGCGSPPKNGHCHDEGKWNRPQMRISLGPYRRGVRMLITLHQPKPHPQGVPSTFSAPELPHSYQLPHISALDHSSADAETPFYGPSGAPHRAGNVVLCPPFDEAAVRRNHSTTLSRRGNESGRHQENALIPPPQKPQSTTQSDSPQPVTLDISTYIHSRSDLRRGLCSWKARARLKGPKL